MSANHHGEIFEVTSVLSTTLEPTGAISATTGDPLSGNSDDQACAQFGVAGIVSRHTAQVPGKSAPECISLRTSSTNYLIATRDVRGMQIAGNLAEGECCVYAPGSTARIMLKKSGGVTLMTTADNTATGQTVQLSLEPDALLFSSPWGVLRYDKTGFHVATFAGAQIHAGGMAAPAPLDALGAYVKIGAPLVQIEASALSMGTAGGQPVTLATTLQAYLTALEAAVVTAVSAVPGGSDPSAALAATIAGAMAPLKLAVASKAAGAS